MTNDMRLFLALIVVGALCVMTHAMMIRFVWSDMKIWWTQLLLCVPPFTPMIAWHKGHRKLALFWAGIFTIYIWLRVKAS